MPVKKILILGGTGEAADLARLIAQKLGSKTEVVTSYSGVTGHQPDLPGTVRVGGFGGAEGLISYIEQEGFDYIIDATHPFAEKISQSCYVAALATNTERVTLVRPEWEPLHNDRWLEVPDMKEAAKLIEKLGGRVLLTIGIKELSVFADIVNAHFVVRMVKEPTEKLPFKSYEVIVGHPPFSVEEECALLKEKKIRMLVTKNSGGEKTKHKIEAARKEGVSVLMIERPAPEPGERVNSVTEALTWLIEHGV
jgi:precorrin-6A/cobalt-precorrin-6A reductase